MCTRGHVMGRTLPKGDGAPQTENVGDEEQAAEHGMNTSKRKTNNKNQLKPRPRSHCRPKWRRRRGPGAAEGAMARNKRRRGASDARPECSPLPEAGRPARGSLAASEAGAPSPQTSARAGPSAARPQGGHRPQRVSDEGGPRPENTGRRTVRFYRNHLGSSPFGPRLHDRLGPCPATAALLLFRVSGSGDVSCGGAPG